jgi:hypothetical protein
LPPQLIARPAAVEDVDDPALLVGKGQIPIDSKRLVGRCAKVFRTDGQGGSEDPLDEGRRIGVS